MALRTEAVNDSSVAQSGQGGRYTCVTLIPSDGGSLTGNIFRFASIRGLFSGDSRAGFAPDPLWY
jgi:hypothetical protein